MKKYTGMGVIALACILATSGFCQEPIAYPAKGQSQDQMDKDKYQCHTWAKQQTGFDPMQQAAAPPAAAGEPRSSALRGAAGGAAVGAIGGAIAGDAGKGAAIGAASGGVIGGVRNRRERQQIAENQQAQVQASNQRLSSYNRAFSVCMKGRGYTTES